MKSGAESGWDYSSRCFQRFTKKFENSISRWFVGNESLDGEEELLKVKPLIIINKKSLQSLNLANIEQPSPDWCQQKKQVGTADIVPVDLNSFLCKNAKILSDLFARFWMFFLFCDFHFATFYRMENPTKSAEYERKYESLRDSIHAVLYSDNLWHDFNIVTRYFKLKKRVQTTNVLRKSTTRQHTGGFYPSNLAPLYSDCIPASLDLGMVVVEIAKLSDTLGQPGGPPSSTIESRWIPGFFCFPDVSTLAQAAVGLPKCVAAIGGNDCEYCQQQSTNNLSFMNQVVSLEKTNSTIGQSLAKTIASNFLNNVLRYMDWLYTRDL